MASTLPPGELFALDTLVTPTAQGIASRVLARTAAGNITLFAFDAGEELSEHTAPFDALVITLSGALVLTIGGRDVETHSADGRVDAGQRASCGARHGVVAHDADHAARARVVLLALGRRRDRRRIVWRGGREETRSATRSMPFGHAHPSPRHARETLDTDATRAPGLHRSRWEY